MTPFFTLFCAGAATASTDPRPQGGTPGRAGGTAGTGTYRQSWHVSCMAGRGGTELAHGDGTGVPANGTESGRRYGTRTYDEYHKVPAHTVTYVAT